MLLLLLTGAQFRIDTAGHFSILHNERRRNDALLFEESEQ